MKAKFKTKPCCIVTEQPDLDLRKVHGRLTLSDYFFKKSFQIKYTHTKKNDVTKCHAILWLAITQHFPSVQITYLEHTWMKVSLLRRITISQSGTNQCKCCRCELQALGLYHVVNYRLKNSLALLTFHQNSACGHTFNWTNHYWRNISCTNVGNNTLIWDFGVTLCWHQPWRSHALHVCVGFLIIPPRQDMSVSIIGESKLPRGVGVSAVMDWEHAQENPTWPLSVKIRGEKKIDGWSDPEVYWFIFTVELL